MARKVFRKLLGQREAKKIFYDNLPRKKAKIERVELHKALGRVLAEEIFSDLDIPPFDRASMDGFAVIAQDTSQAEEDNPIKLEVVGELKAGYVFEGIIKQGQCIEISTGAPMPNGADAVVMVEHTQRDGNQVDIYKSVTPSRNTMAAGTDIQLGERVLAKGKILTSRELAVLAAIGKDQVKVRAKPSIGIFSSGDEIIPLGSSLKPGKLYDINSTSIATSLLENGGDPTILGILEDKRETLQNEMESALDKFDIVVVSGGTSAGMGDILYEVIDDLGEPGLLVHGVKVKPGKPTILAVCNGTPVIGLPGYPASALSIYQLFVLPLVREWAGIPPVAESTIIKALVKQRIRSVEGRYEFKPMYLMKGNNEWIAYPVPGGSGAITSVALADGFVQIPENTHFLPAGSEISIHLLSENITPPDLQIIGSHDLALAKLQQNYEDQTKYTVRSISVGSNGGVAAIRRGEAHLAGIHLLDPKHGYNQWVIEDLDAQIIPGFLRMQGFIVKKNNPKEIFSLEDLTKKGVKFLNRNQGSGTRILLDTLLNKANINSDGISGYLKIARSHSSAAQAVKKGYADVTIGIQAVAQDKELEFISLREEEYDLLVKNEYRENEAVTKFIELLRSSQFKSMLDRLPGYKAK